MVIHPCSWGSGWGPCCCCCPWPIPGFELQDYAIPRLLGLFAGLLFLFGLYQWRLERPTRDRLLYLLLRAVAIEALLGLVQYYLLTPGNWIGYDIRANRPYGIFQQPNVMASFMATGLALAIWLELRGGQPPLAQGAALWGDPGQRPLLGGPVQSRVGQLGGVMALLLLSARWVVSGGWAGCWVCQAWACSGWPPSNGMAGQAGAGDLPVRRHALGLLALCCQTHRRGALDRLGATAASSPFSSALHGRQGAEPRHGADPDTTWITPTTSFSTGRWRGMAPCWHGADGGALLWRLGRAGSSEGALLALVTPILLHTQTGYPFYHAIALWWALLLLLWRWMRRWRSWPATPTGATICRPLVAAALRPSPFPIVIPFMLTALHTAWVVTKHERGGYKQPALLLDIVNPMAWLDPGGV